MSELTLPIQTLKDFMKTTGIKTLFCRVETVDGFSATIRSELEDGLGSQSRVQKGARPKIEGEGKE